MIKIKTNQQESSTTLNTYMFFFLPLFSLLLNFSFSSTTSCLLTYFSPSTLLLVFVLASLSLFFSLVIPSFLFPPSVFFPLLRLPCNQLSKWLTGSVTSSASSAAAECGLYPPQTDRKAGCLRKVTKSRWKVALEDTERWSFKQTISANRTTRIRQVGWPSTCPGDWLNRLNVCGHEQPGVGQ